MTVLYPGAKRLRDALVVSVAAFCTHLGMAQELATTEAGRKVRLHSNGTWEEVSAAPAQAATPLAPSAGTIEKLALRVPGYVFSFDRSKWEKTNEEPGRIMFRHKDGDGYGMLIVERIGMPLDRMPEIALQMARRAAPDAAIISQEMRTVNGRTMLLLRMKATLQGIPFSYLNQYYSGKTGNVQVLTFSGEQLFGEYAKEFETFQSGLVVGD
jgi:hypothetical protein